MMTVLVLAALGGAPPSVGPGTSAAAWSRDTVRGDSVLLCVIDAATRAPVYGASVYGASVHGASVSDTTVTRTTPAQRLSRDCLALPAGVFVVRHVAHHAERVSLVTPTAQRAAQTDRAAGTTTLLTRHVVALTPLGLPRSLAPVLVSADEAQRDARNQFTVSVNAARNAGAGTTAQLIDQLPFTNTRSARGETAVSLRGARREQVVITLDGLPLNDPSTGVADVGDLPLAALGTATAALGADPLGAGSGAVGGVLALTTSPQRMLSLRTGSFAHRRLEGAWSGQWRATRLFTAALAGAAANDFFFDNAAGASGNAVRERRVNNDDQRATALISANTDRWQFAALASRSDRGMVGPANVRTYDADRARADRLLLRAQSQVASLQVVGGLKQFVLAYRDPTRPALNTDAQVRSADVELRGATDRGWSRASLAWRLGGGHDDVRATGALLQDRRRGFATAQLRWQERRTHADLGVRADAVDGMSPRLSWSASGDRALSDAWRVYARAAQNLRVPTLYDLYFSSPQRLSVQALRPERVRADLELGSRWSARPSVGRLAFDVALVSRDTRDAIVWFPGNFGWSPANVGREQLRGVELRMQVTPVWGDVSAWTSWYDAELRTGTLNIPVPYVPSIAAGGQWLVHTRGLTGALRWRHMGRRPFSAGPRNPDFELPAVALLDLSLTHALPAALTWSHGRSTITWSIDNAANRAWQSVRGFPSPGRSWAITVTIQQAS